jgi:hypothetical protein
MKKFCTTPSDCSNISEGPLGFVFAAAKECPKTMAWLQKKCTDESLLFLDPEVCPDEDPIEWLKSMNSWTLTDCHHLSDCELIPLKWLDESVVEPFCKEL